MHFNGVASRLFHNTSGSGCTKSNFFQLYPFPFKIIPKSFNHSNKNKFLATKIHQTLAIMYLCMHFMLSLFHLCVEYIQCV